MIDRVVLDQGHVGVAGRLESRGRARPGGRRSRSAGSGHVVGDEADVGVAGQLAARLHADDHRARSRSPDWVAARGRRAGCRGRSSPPRWASRPEPSWREVHRLVGEVGLGDAELELGEVEVFAGSRRPLAAGTSRSERRSSASLPRPRRRASSSMSTTRNRHDPPSRNARISRCWALDLRSSGLMPRTRAASSRV